MDDVALEMSGELSTELDRNKVIDPRSVPVRFSTLKQFARSPLHYWHAVQAKHSESLAMRLGLGTHALLFGQPIAVWTGPQRRGTAWESFRREHDGQAIVNQREHAEAQAMVDSVRRCDLAMRLLDNVTMEQRIDWTYAGRSCRSTPDVRGTYHIVDLKTARSSEPDRFSRQSMWMGYHAQLAFYLDAVKESGLGAPHEAYVIAVESSPPYPVTVLRLTERAIDQGRRMCRLWFERLLQCEAANEWPAYSQSVVDLDVPEQDVDLVFAEEDAPAS